MIHTPITPLAGRGGRVYDAGGKMKFFDTGVGNGLANRSLANSLFATSKYLGSLGGGEVQEESSSFITSLVSGESDMFSSYMSKGEKAFKEGDYQAAFDQFRLANSLDPRNPESLLSLMHTSFAISRWSYFRTYYFLSRAIKCLPELPMTPLDPKGFFGSPEQYASQLKDLEDHVRSVPSDAEAQVVLAYFRWFDKDFDGARSALNEARKIAGKEIVETIDLFWDGMKASGKVSGLLDGQEEPTSLPTTLPATRSATPTAGLPRGFVK